jgi:hypothetical protein
MSLRVSDLDVGTLATVSHSWNTVVTVALKLLLERVVMSGNQGNSWLTKMIPDHIARVTSDTIFACYFFQVRVI